MEDSGREHEKWIPHMNPATVALSERSRMYISNIFIQIHVHGHTHTYTLSPQMTPSTNVKTGKITLFGDTKIGSKTIFFRKQEKDYSGSEMNNCLRWGERNL